MGNKRYLKAFVRYDGNKKVVSGPIFAPKKPSGNWIEIPAYLCCNFSTTTTSTTAPR